MTPSDIIAAAIERRRTSGLSVEVMLQTESRERRSYVRHCIDAADRDAYIARCKARGESFRILD